MVAGRASGMVEAELPEEVQIQPLAVDGLES
eukprot:COSAG02_NODE_19460_length_880_cov_9.346991_1_plen_30_part_01